jgi:hypothetical protein
MAVLPDSKVSKVFNDWGSLQYGSGFVDVNESASYELAGPGGKTWKAALGEKLPPVTLARHAGKTFELVKREDLDKAAKPLIEAKRAGERKRAGKKGGAEDSLRKKAAEAKREAEIKNTAGRRTLAACAKAWPADPSAELLRDLAITAIRSCWSDTLGLVAQILGLTEGQGKGAKRTHDELAKEHLKTLASKKELLGFVALLMYARGLGQSFDGEATKRLHALCALVKVDGDAILRGVKAEAKAKEDAKGKKKPAAKAAPAKAAKKGAKAKAGATKAPAKAAAAVPAPAPAASKGEPTASRWWIGKGVAHVGRAVPRGEPQRTECGVAITKPRWRTAPANVAPCLTCKVVASAPDGATPPAATKPPAKAPPAAKAAKVPRREVVLDRPTASP